MSVTYTKVTYTIQEKLQAIINDEYRSVYISSEYVDLGDENVRIYITGNSDIETSNVFEERLLEGEIVFYYKDQDPIRREKFIKNRSDRLKQLLLNNQNITEWYDLEIPDITYGVDDEIDGLGFAQFSITVKSYNQWS